jgi:hypothetical protein
MKSLQEELKNIKKEKKKKGSLQEEGNHYEKLAAHDVVSLNSWQYPFVLQI